MAKSSTIIVAVLAVIAAVLVAGNAQMAPAAAPGPATLDCFPYLLNMSDCLSYVELGSNLTAPEKPCCPEVKTLFEVQPICLCELLASPDKAPVPIDVSRATSLTSVCKIDVPLGSPAAACAFLGVPVGAPAPATGAHAPATGVPVPDSSAPASGLPMTPEGSPSAPVSPNDGRRIAGSQRHLLFGLAAVAFLGFF